MHRPIVALVLAIAILSAFDAQARSRADDWRVVTDAAPWGGRAGLQAVELDGSLFVLGGRTPRPPQTPPIPGDSQIWGDVWRSDDGGSAWQRVLETDDASHWPARAYFQAVTMKDHVYVLGGQNFIVFANPGCPVPPPPGCPPFISSSEFFDDVWRSADGVNWEALTDSAGWDGRAGLMAAAFDGHLYVFGGSRNDDSSIIGGPPARIYYNDVWRSADGARWERVLEHAPWSPRAGSAVTVKDGWLYLLGGEAGFLCGPPPCDLPYFNDVWRTRDGMKWQLVTESAGWSPRPGHQCVTLGKDIVCFGGFGLPVNPIDMWASSNGKQWRLLDDAPWNAVSPEQGKYDFDALVVEAGDDRHGNSGKRGGAILTFGGDRETFDFSDSLNYLRVDDEVWSYGPAEALDGEDDDRQAGGRIDLALRTESPVAPAGRVVLSFDLPQAAPVRLAVYDVRGRLVRTLVDGEMGAGTNRVEWSAAGGTSGPRAAPGIYFAQLEALGQRRAVRVLQLP